MKINVIAGNVVGGGVKEKIEWRIKVSYLVKIMKTYSVRACISLTLNKEHKNFSSLETAVVKENASYLLLFFF